MPEQVVAARPWRCAARTKTTVTMPAQLGNTPWGYIVAVRDKREDHPMAGYSGTKDDYAKRLRRIEGQVRGIQRMVDEDVYCIDVLTQISAATKALQAVSLGLLEDHIGHCVVEAARESDEAAHAKVREASDAIARLVRS
jgi:DNA-binding FrmR family transcriptional regulator